MTELNGREFIVAGGAGYIGSHVCKAIHDHGGIPITIDNLSSGHAHAVKWGPLFNTDIRDKVKLCRVFADYPNAKTVVHLASSIEVSLGEKHPAEFYDNNVNGALALLMAMKDANISRLIFSSTCATYGESQNMPLRETQPQHPISTYGKTKLAIEHMIQSFQNAYDLNYIIFRYFNAAGADDGGEIGEQHEPETHLIPNAIKSAMGNGQRMKLFGMDYDTPDGTCIRDYIHVTDIAHAHINAIAAMDDGLSKAELNIGTGKGISNLDILKAIERVSGLDLPFDVASRRKGDLSQLFADVTKAKAEIGFEPRHSDLDNIIRTAWYFHSSN